MSKEMIVSVNGREKKIAILENGKVTEFYIERGEENQGVVGNVYKGRVMRVLPGMQSAFVDIGLERDAFLYVSDFFDEEEEIERIVMEKSKKGSQEEAKREANEQIDRSRIEREKQMESVQEIAEPLGDFGREDEQPDAVEEINQPGTQDTRERQPERGQRGQRGGRGRKDRDFEPQGKASDETPPPVFEVEFDNSGFERISDDDDRSGGSSKDSYGQEPVFEKVRAIEFEMKGSATAEVGSLLDAVNAESSGFERIADEDEETSAPEKGRGRSRASKSGDKDVKAAPKAKASKSTAKKSATTKPKTAKGKKVKDEDALEDAEASIRESDSNAEMAVRRGGRGRRRGGKPKVAGQADDGTEENDASEISDIEASGEEPIEVQPEREIEIEPEIEPVESAPATETERDPNESPQAGLDRNRSRRGRGARNERADRPTSVEQSDRPDTSGERDDRPNIGNERTKTSGERSERPSGNRERGERPASGSDRNERAGSGGKRYDRNDRSGRPPQPTISDLLKEGQEILVQIAKEPIAKKGARITSHIALPGRYLVYMPTIEHLGVSRKIESASERSRLRTLIQRIRQDDEIVSGGFIVRTAGIGVSEEDLRNDAKYLARMWVDSKKNSEKKKSPAMVHQDLDLVQRILRDQLADDFTAIRVDSEEEYLRTVEFINLIQPRMVNRIKLYTRDEPILEYYGVQEEIDKALKPRVWLKSGGYLVINQTEALVAIDVNTGKFVGKGNARLEDTITRTNMEAVDEIARQIRLRDLGGIIVLDLIDMEDRRNRNKVAQALQEALASDKSPNKVLSFNDFGLIIMTRKRVKQSLERTMCSPCEYCEGSGWVKSATTLCYEILAEARRLSKNVEDVRHTTLRVHPDVAKTLRSTEREVLEEIEAYLGHVDIASDKSVHQGQFDFAFV